MELIKLEFDAVREAANEGAELASQELAELRLTTTSDGMADFQFY